MQRGHPEDAGMLPRVGDIEVALALNLLCVFGLPPEEVREPAARTLPA